MTTTQLYKGSWADPVISYHGEVHDVEENFPIYYLLWITQNSADTIDWILHRSSADLEQAAFKFPLYSLKYLLLHLRKPWTIGGSHSIFSLSMQLDMLSEQQEKESMNFLRPHRMAYKAKKKKTINTF